MKHKKVPVTEIVVPETRVTAVYDAELTAILHDTIESMGVLQPVVLVGVPGGYHLVDGLHRLQEAIAQGQGTIDAVIYDGEAKEALLMNLVLNRVRGKTKASEMVHVVATLFREYGLDPDGIKERTGLSRDYIEKLIKVGSAAPGVLEMLDEEIIGMGIAWEISRLPYHAQQEEIVAKARIWKYTVKEMAEFVDQVLELMDTTPPGEEPPVPVQRVEPVYRCEGCKTETSPRWLQMVSLCPNCFGEIWRLKQGSQTSEAPKT